jgi:hypothetical protein
LNQVEFSILEPREHLHEGRREHNVHCSQIFPRVPGFDGGYEAPGILVESVDEFSDSERILGCAEFGMAFGDGCILCAPKIASR